MSVEIKWLGHSSFRITDGRVTVYLDPYNLSGPMRDGDVICISHAHYDHCSPDDVARVAAANGVIVCPKDVAGGFKNAIIIAPGKTVDTNGLKIEGVAAYNIDKKFHPQSNGWCGYVLNIGGKRIYYSGDSDMIPEMKDLKNIDVAILPVGGTYTMTALEAVQAAEDIGCAKAIPCHWGSVVGSEMDAREFAGMVKCEGVFLKPGRVTTI